MARGEKSRPLPKRPFRNWLSGVQLIEQRLGLLQIERVESLGERDGDPLQCPNRGLRMPLASACAVATPRAISSAAICRLDLPDRANSARTLLIWLAMTVDQKLDMPQQKVGPSLHGERRGRAAKKI
jgi:hypothetical protein